MSTHKSLNDNVKTRYNNLVAEVDGFRRQFNNLHAETKAKYREALDTLDAQYEALKTKFAHLSETGGSALEQRENEFEIYLTEMEEHFHGITTTIQGDGSIGWAEGQAAQDHQDSIGWGEGQGHTQDDTSEGWAEGQSKTHKAGTSEGWAEGYQDRS